MATVPIPLLTEDDLAAAAYLILDRILERTASSKSVSGAKFAPYNPRYAARKGVTRDNVDLRSRGSISVGASSSANGLTGGNFDPGLGKSASGQEHMLDSIKVLIDGVRVERPISRALTATRGPMISPGTHRITLRIEGPQEVYARAIHFGGGRMPKRPFFAHTQQDFEDAKALIHKRIRSRLFLVGARTSLAGLLRRR